MSVRVSLSRVSHELLFSLEACVCVVSSGKLPNFYGETLAESQEAKESS
jgi:hypothetical protein